MMRFSARAGLCTPFTLLVLLIAATTFGQVVTGTILGRVTDSTGAVVPGATIQIQNVSTGLSQSTQADREGRYLVRNLPPGSYEVTLQQSGFRTEVRRGVVLSVASEVTVNVELAVGAVTEAVEVTAEAPLIETTNATVSGLVSADQMRDLPLNGRSLDQLALLTPGVFASRYTQNVSTLGRGMRISINGGRQDANVYLIDGTVANDHAANGPNSAGGNALGVEGILEYRVLTHNFGAEYGRNSGGMISMVTRAGTNEFHGSVYEFLRNKVFDARNFFNVGELPPFKRNQFGGAVGGPVMRDRMFFFANYEGLRQRQGRTLTSTVPDLNARQGLLPDPVTGVPRPVPFNPASAPYLNLYPLPTGRIFGDGTAEGRLDLSIPTNEDYGMARMDFRLSDTDSVYWRYMVDTGTSTFPRPGGITADVEGGGYHFAVLSHSHIFSANSLNEFRVAFNRTDPAVTSIPIGNWDPDALGFVEGNKFGGITYSSGNQGGGGGSGASQQLSGVELRAPDRRFTQNIFQWTDTFSTVRGDHAVKLGFDAERIQLNFPSGNAGGTMRFDGGLADLIAGRPSRFTFGLPDVTLGWHRNKFAWFVQDDFRLRPNLTLNLGLRHEFFSTPTEVHGLSANLIRVTDAQAAVGPPFTSSKNTFSPRFGLAWDPTGSGKTAVRLGSGIYYNYFDGRTWYMGAGTASGAVFRTGSIDVRNPPWPKVNPANYAGTPRSTYSIGNGIDGYLKEPTVIHYNLDVQRQLASTVSVRMGYVGSHGYHMGRLVAENIRIPQILADGTKLFPMSGPAVNSNFVDISGLRTDSRYNYNALQVVLQKTLSAGLLLTANYTWGKAMAEADEVGNAQSNGVAPTTLDRDNRARDYSLSTFHQNHTFVMNGRYQMPWDRLLDSPVAKAILGGWSANGIFSASSGEPFNIQTGFNRSRNNDPQQTDRPDLAPGFSNNPTSGVTAGCRGVLAGQKLGTPDLWFDPCAFVPQTAGTFGNLGRNTVIAPGIWDFDFTFLKNTPFGDKKSLEFRAEFFNLFNHASFLLPTRVIFNSDGSRTGSAGVIGTTATSNRQIQLGIKLNF